MRSLREEVRRDVEEELRLMIAIRRGVAVLLSTWVCCGCAQRALPPSPTLAESRHLAIEVDHVYLWVSTGAEAEMAALRRAGFTVDAEPTRHPGQGTAAVSVEFDNAYLELIYVDPDVSVDTDMEGEVADFERRSKWRVTGASPIGVGLHRTSEASGPFPFSTRPYRPEWLREGTAIERLGVAADTLAPRLFIVPDYLAVEDSAALAARMREDPTLAALLDHPVGVRRLTGVRITVSDRRGLTEPTQLLTESAVAEFKVGERPLLELTFDSARREEEVDLRPTMPLVLRY